MAVDVAAGQDNADATAAQLAFLLEGCGERGRARSLSQVVCVLVEGAHGAFDFSFRYFDEAGNVGQHHFESVGVRAATGESIGDLRVGGRFDELALTEADGSGGRLFGDHADDFSVEAESIAGRGYAADGRTQANRHIDGVDGRHGLEELHCITGGAEDKLRVEGIDELEGALGGEGAGKFKCGLEVVAVLDELDSLGEHGLVLLRAVAVGDDDDGFETEKAGGEANALSEIAAGGRDDAGEGGVSIFEPVQVDDCSANFEGADLGVVLMLDPCLSAEALIEKRPGVLRRGRHKAVNECAGGADLVSRR